MKRRFIRWLQSQHNLDIYTANFVAHQERYRTGLTLEQFLDREGHHSYVIGAFNWGVLSGGGSSSFWQKKHHDWCAYYASEEHIIRLNDNTKII